MAETAGASAMSAFERREALKEVYAATQGCTRCPQLVAGRTTVVFGAGNADADLAFVGEAPGATEDEQGLPFVGRAGKLLDTLLGEIGMARSEVFIANVLKCLRYNARVQLGDGSWERVGRLVRSRYSGLVMSLDRDGRLVPRRVTGWHESPVGDRRVFRLRYAACKHAGVGRVGVELTGDHPVLTERGYVAVQDLEQGDRIATGQGLSNVAFDVVCGTVLGDACLQASSSHLTLAHSERQAGYARFKAHLLAELSPRVYSLDVAAVAGGDRSYGAVHVRTLAHRALAVLRAEFYLGRTKGVPPWIADRLNVRMLAIWFMDDGYLRVRTGGRRPLAEIATVGFTDDDLQILLIALRRLGLAAKASRGRLYFNVSATERLSELIAPYVPSSMRYKLSPDVRGRVPFDPSGLEPGPPEVIYDYVEVEEVDHRTRRDKTFFCLDVDETHNFVTAGGVVHNCRPPGNRDPQPIEIENCREYLYSQVELIQPRVLCTLGNFSTKLLRGDPSGITRVHGHPEVITLGRRAVRLYPLYHPAAALRTPAMLDALRADFARIPELLALPEPEQPPSQDAEEALELPELAELAADGTQSHASDSAMAVAPADQLGLF